MGSTNTTDRALPQPKHKQNSGLNLRESNRRLKMPPALPFSYHFSLNFLTCRAGRARPSQSCHGCHRRTSSPAPPQPAQGKRACAAPRRVGKAARTRRKEGRCACAAACRRSWRPTAARRRMRGGAAVSSGCLFGKWIRARRRPLPLLPPAALPPLPAMARDYDHLFKLLIIGDSGEGSRPAPPRPLGTEGRGLRGAAGPEGGGGAGLGPAGCGGALGLCQPCGDRGPPQRRVVRLRDAAVSGPSTAGGG